MSAFQSAPETSAGEQSDVSEFALRSPRGGGWRMKVQVTWILVNFINCQVPYRKYWVVGRTEDKQSAGDDLKL